MIFLLKWQIVLLKKKKWAQSAKKKKKKKMSMFPSIQNILPEIEEYCHWGRMLNIMELCQ